MNFLDMKTIVFIASLTYVICTFFIYLGYRQGKNRFNGLLLILVNFILQTLGFLLIVLRGIIPDFFSIIVANTFIVGGTFLSLIGYEQFLCKKGKHYHNILLLILFIFIEIYFTYFKESLTFRNLNISIAALLLCFQIFYLFIFRTSKDERKLTFFIGMVYLVYCLVSLMRIIGMPIFKDTTNDFLKSGFYDSLIIVFYQILFIVLTYSIILILNRKLIDSLTNEEEKFVKSFHTSPYAILLTNFDDGKIFDVNEGFERITGFLASEVIGKTTLDIKVWESSIDREQFVKKLKEDKKIYNYEIKFRRKNEEIGVGLLSADIININNRKIILTSVNEITERKEAEEKIKALLNEKELLLREVHHRIKNNMNIVYSLLSLQAWKVKDENTRNIILDSANRVRSMLVLYDKLYRKNVNEPLSIKEYLPSLIKEILAIFPDNEKIKTNVDIEDIKIDQNKISKVGILINELVTNSLKYAFKNIDNAQISLKCFSENDFITIDYKDNGVGITNSNKNNDIEGFGMGLIKVLVEELKGAIIIKEENGTNFIISFPK